MSRTRRMTTTTIPTIMATHAPVLIAPAGADGGAEGGDVCAATITQSNATKTLVMLYMCTIMYQ